MPITLQALLAEPEFHLRPLACCDDPELSSRPIAWVYNSELADPAPWLGPGQLLLTDGLAFLDDPSSTMVERYVDSLVAREVVGLGFATGIAHDTVPPRLVEGCARAGLPLFEVAEKVPFLAIIRHVADASAAEQQERLVWFSTAQRAITRAALRPDGLAAVLGELERQLNCWVALYDASGSRVEIRTSTELPASLEQEVEVAVRRTLRRGSPAGGRLETAGTTSVTLQTLGRSGRLRGVLAVGIGTAMDTAENDLVTSVIGLASIALEQSNALETARLRLRAGVLELLLAGTMQVADQTAQRLWGSLPPAPVRIGVLAADGDPRPVFDALELMSERRGGRVFFAERDDEIVVIVHQADFDAVAELLAGYGVVAGFSAPTPWRDLLRPLREARWALARASTVVPLVTFEDLVQQGFLGLLESSGGESVAHRLLAPLAESGDPDHSQLLQTLSVWLEHNGSWESAARELSVHRHTLRNRISVIETLLGVDLTQFSERAELWTALRLVDGDQRRPPV